MNVDNVIATVQFSPNSLQFPNSWLGHLSFAAWVMQEIKPSIFVELGTHTGNSYFAFCQAVLEYGIHTRCYSVDTWQGDEHAGYYGDEIFSQVNSYHEKHYAEFSRLLRMTFDDAVSYFSDQSIELLHIDGLHTYQAVRHDFQNWLPKLAPGAVVMLHDTNVRERGFGVWKLWEELKEQYPNHLEFVHSHGLGVLQLNSAPAEKKIKWLGADSADSQRVKTLFAPLGSRQLERFTIKELQNHIVAFKDDLTVREGQVNELNSVLALRDEQIAQLNKALADREEQLAGLNLDLGSREGQIAELNEAVVGRDLQIAALSQTQASQEEQIADYQEIVANLNRQIRVFVDNLNQQKVIEQLNRTLSNNVIIRLGCSLERLRYRKLREYYTLKNALKTQPLFDAEWYRQQYPDVKSSKTSPLYHYYFFGVQEGRNPNRYFFTTWYRDEYQDVGLNDINPLLHYILFGVKEEKNPNPYFDTQRYLSEYPDAVRGGVNPLLHFLNYGEEEGKMPNPFFSPNWYRSEYPDVVKSGMSPLLHYIARGEREKRKPHPFFDTAWYAFEYKDVLHPGMEPLPHYLKHGIKEQKNPNPFFDVKWYLRQYPDCAERKIHPVLHYMKYGVEQGTNPNPYFDTRWYLKEYPEVAAKGSNPLLHYMQHGREERTKPNPIFDTQWYLSEYQDVAQSGMDPLHHYIKYGQKEGRKTCYTEVLPGYELARNGRLSQDFFLLNQPNSAKGILGFDVVLISYNSEKWIDNCLGSLLPQSKNITITIIDNGSSDDTLNKIEKFRDKFESLTVIANPDNLGFGAANNVAAQATTGEYLVFMNIDTELHDAETFAKLSDIITNSKSDVVAWELRQLPYEHPKCYDPVSLETSWFSGAAVVIKRQAFTEVGGFDEKLFMYCEDVDLSWRLRAKGYRLRYCPTVTITHYSYTDPGEVKPLAQLFGVKHNYFLRNRFGSPSDIAEGKELLERYSQELKTSLSPSLYQKLTDVEKESSHFQSTNCPPNQFFKPYFDRFDYDIMREGAFYCSTLANSSVKVSVIVRTIGRVHYLKRAVYSLLNQTYQNIEIIVVEDGSNKAEEFCRTFSDANLIYRSLAKVGRCQAGNVGLELATGEFCNFLDEDDLLYCDHIETLVAVLSENPHVGAAWASAFCVATEESKDRLQYSERNYLLAHSAEPNHESILEYNFFPIQAVLFRRKCYEQLGGFDPEVDLLEDWDLWIRYYQQFEFQRVAKTTSLYRVPFQKEISEERRKNLHKYYDHIQRKFRN